MQNTVYIKVKKVKKSENGIISDPLYICPDATLGEAVKMLNAGKRCGVNRKKIAILKNEIIIKSVDLKLQILTAYHNMLKICDIGINHKI